MNAFADLETPLDEEPLFPVQAPDGRPWSEIDRQRSFLNAMAYQAPRCVVQVNANAGKRHPSKARKEGIAAGVPDVTVYGPGGIAACIEFKGYTSAGRPGKLSWAQIAYMNRLHRAGVPVACFFDPHAAVAWLGLRGFPVLEAQ